MQQALIDLLHRHRPFDDTERRHRDQAIEFISRTSACTSRATLEGHVTASAWVLSPDAGSTLLTHQRKLDRWLQPGGHIEDDVTIQDAALREASEESGIHALRLATEALFDIDVHLIPARKTMPAHRHYDFRFLVLSEHSDFVIGTESLSLAWVEIARIVDEEADASILRMARKTNAVLAEAGRPIPGKSSRGA